MHIYRATPLTLESEDLNRRVEAELVTFSEGIIERNVHKVIKEGLPNLYLILYKVQVVHSSTLHLYEHGR